jgi:hypothetical protein
VRQGVLFCGRYSYCANGRTTVRLCSIGATKRCRKHSYHDREIPEHAEALLAEQKPGLIGPGLPRLQRRIPPRSKQVFLIVIERTNSLFIVSFIAGFLKR